MLLVLLELPRRICSVGRTVRKGNAKCIEEARATLAADSGFHLCLRFGATHRDGVGVWRRTLLGLGVQGYFKKLSRRLHTMFVQLLLRRRLFALVRTILSPFFSTSNGSLVPKSCDYLLKNGYEGMYNHLGCAVFCSLQLTQQGSTQGKYSV